MHRVVPGKHGPCLSLCPLDVARALPELGNTVWLHARVGSRKPLEGGLNRGLENGRCFSDFCCVSVKERKNNKHTRYIVVRYYDLRPLPKLPLRIWPTTSITSLSS